MDKHDEPNEDSTLVKVLDEINVGINDASPVYPVEEEIIPESTGKQAVRYLFWGVLSVIVNLGIFFITYQLLHLNYQLANVIAWFVGVQTGFWIDRIIVFRHKTATWFMEMLMFYATRILTYLIEAATLWVGISILSDGAVASKVVGQILAIVGNYVFSKFFIFKEK